MTNDDDVVQTEDLACVALSLNLSSTQTGLHLLNSFPFEAFQVQLHDHTLELPVIIQLEITSLNPHLP